MKQSLKIALAYFVDDKIIFNYDRLPRESGDSEAFIFYLNEFEIVTKVDSKLSIKEIIQDYNIDYISIRGFDYPAKELLSIPIIEYCEQHETIWIKPLSSQFASQYFSN